MCASKSFHRPSKASKSLQTSKSPDPSEACSSRIQNEEAASLRNQPDLVVATPGRLSACQKLFLEPRGVRRFRRGAFVLSHLASLVTKTKVGFPHNVRIRPCESNGIFPVWPAAALSCPRGLLDHLMNSHSAPGSRSFSGLLPAGGKQLNNGCLRGQRLQVVLRPSCLDVRI